MGEQGRPPWEDAVWAEIQVTRRSQSWDHLGAEHSKGHEVGMSFGCLRNRKEASVTSEWVRETMAGEIPTPVASGSRGQPATDTIFLTPPMAEAGVRGVVATFSSPALHNNLRREAWNWEKPTWKILTPRENWDQLVCFCCGDWTAFSLLKSCLQWSNTSNN